MRLGGSGCGGGGGVPEPTLDMTQLTERDCLFRAVMARCGSDAPGMTTCYTYFARAFSVFAAHAEDHNLPSVNQLVFGAPKVWLVVAPRDFARATAALRGAVRNKELPPCPQAVAHKLQLPSLALLRAEGIEVRTLVQRQGDLVITAPGAIHFGVNCGDNVAESTNVADGDWLSSGAFRDCRVLGACSCKASNAWSLVPRATLPLEVVRGAVAAPDVGPRFGLGGGGGGGGGVGWEGDL